MSNHQPIINALVGCDMEKTTEMVQQVMDLGIDAKDILNQGLIPGMNIVDEKNGIRRDVYPRSSNGR
jgi:methanogenic corrinoid protein MtbC1